jgi:RimJ/RimL family protein N-acetyltransferase
MRQFRAGRGELFRYLFESPPDSRDAFGSWLETAAASTDPLYFAAVDRETGRAVGRLTLMRIDQTHE